MNNYLTLTDLQDMLREQGIKVGNTALPRLAREERIPGVFKVGGYPKSPWLISEEDGDAFIESYIKKSE